MPSLRQISSWLGRWYVALAASFVLGAIVLLPGLGNPGLWEPHERTLSDRIAPPKAVQAERDAQQAAAPKPKPKPPPKQAGDDSCKKSAPEDPVARSLTTRAIVTGRDHLGDSDRGRRLPLALLGLLTLLATAGIALRSGGARAGLVTAIVLASMPLLVLQSRMLTSEIGTACGAALIIYGLLALGRARDVLDALLARVAGRPADQRPRQPGLAVLDTAVGVLALALGIAIGFVAGGALLGLLVPIGAFAAAGMLGVPAVVDGVRAVRNLALRIGRRGNARWAAGREPWAYQGAGYVPALIATLLAGALIYVLAHQLYDLEEAIKVAGRLPAERHLFGTAIVDDECWSWALGGLWRADNDLRYPFDSAFELIAYGTFPWGILGPIAMFALLRDPDRERRLVGALTLAWAGSAWIATEVFQRKVGFTIWAGFPAIAIAIGVWFDRVLARRRQGDREAMPSGAMLLGLFIALATLAFGKDLQSFPEKLTSLLVGNDAIKYPTASRVADLPFSWWVPLIGVGLGVAAILLAVLWHDDHERNERLRRRVLVPVGTTVAILSFAVFAMGLPTKRWVLLNGGVIALGIALTMMLWRPGDDAGARRSQRLATWAAAVALAASVVLAAFWSFVWQPRLAVHLSSKAMFEAYQELRREGDQLVIMGDLGQAPRSYTDATPEIAKSRPEIVNALKRQNRVFAIAPQTELCALHREVGEAPYFVLDDRNTRNLLLSNRVDGTTDKNPLASMIAHAEPTQIKSRPKGRVVWDNRIELLGWDIPAKVERGSKFEVVMYYKILQPVGGNWTAIMHFDGPIRFSGDHKPIKDRCPTSTWQLGDYIIDRHTVVAGASGHPLGRYELWVGFFTGSAPNFRNMTVSQAPGDIRDATDRVKITSVVLH